MLRGRFAAGSVYACFVCLLGLTAQPAKLRTQDIFPKINTLKAKVPLLEGLNCTLYTPTRQDYQNCPVSTLRCFADEVKVLTEELEAIGVPGMRRFPLITSLKKHARWLEKTQQKTSDCLQCELLTEKEPQPFLGDLISIIQMVNS
ncbi:interleukin 15, like isoform X2 [Plectropomus leopardus]|uniref:interleukin 15, like isoform X2 n=1 Tax=Plectropomus leopardus TaxID=160734 RepID=UPI001C4A7B82|nr:interleukin 15, like isoform X2 [Plectropomus leopardus]